MTTRGIADQAIHQSLIHYILQNNLLPVKLP
jgi:hypothetical protein